MFRKSLTLIALLAALGCNQGDERLIEKAKIEGKAQAESELKAQLDNLEQLAEKARAEGRAQAQAELQVQIENMQALIDRAREEGRAAAEATIGEENRNLAYRASEMEADLASRQSFFQAVAGTYEGSMQTDQAVFNIRLTLVPNVPPIAVGRVRTLEEIAHDLTNLTFNIQVLQWNPRSVLSAVGCRIQAVRPDLVNGVIQIASESCPNFYALRLSNTSEPSSTPDVVAKAAREGKVQSVGELKGEVQPTTNASIFRFTASKVSR